MGRVLASVSATLALAAVLCCVSPAHASTALELVRMARSHEVARRDDVALRRYMEALALDPTCEEAYMGLGALRARNGDLREAERVYSVALEHVPHLRAARVARASVRRALGQRAEAEEDMLVAAGPDSDPTTLRALATWHGEDGNAPAQLAIWRRIAARAEQLHDPVLDHEARTMIHALLILVGPADPAASPADRDNAVRSAIAAAARRSRR